MSVERWPAEREYANVLRVPERERDLDLIVETRRPHGLLALIRAVFACRCGHPKAAHAHYTRQTWCSTAPCECEEFGRSR